MVESTLDHCILTILDSLGPIHRGKRRFHLEAMWVIRADYCEIIESAWNSGSLSTTLEGVASNLQRYACDLATWNKNVVGNISKKITKKRKTLNSLAMQDQGGSLGSKLNQIRRGINDLLDSEETMWHQRSKVHWYKEGDRNIKFFHAQSLERRKKNTLLGLWNNEGHWCESKESIAATAVDYFMEIYSTSSPIGIREVIEAIPIRVTHEMNSELTRPFTKEEVIRALHQTHQSP